MTAREPNALEIALTPVLADEMTRLTNAWLAADEWDALLDTPTWPTPAEREAAAIEALTDDRDFDDPAHGLGMEAA